MRSNNDDYREIFINDIPLMDVRAPIEFNQGAFPNARNIPLLDDEQRHQIGLCYKNAGEDEAIKLGLELATPEIREERLAQWKVFCEANKQGYLYCFRGGLRSRITQQWIGEQGIDYPLVNGGYKAMRRFLIDDLSKSVQELSLIVVSGLTGCGKTCVLKKISRYIDLEGLANHRGSAFGRSQTDIQPGMIDWENNIAIDFLKLRHQNAVQPIFIEDEGRRIGRATLPDDLFKKMQIAPRAILEASIEDRIQLIIEEYILDAWPNYIAQYEDSAEDEFSRFVLDSLSRIQKRLGAELYSRVRRYFEAALNSFFKQGRIDEFEAGILILLEQYYDPMYRYQLDKKNARIVFKGSEKDYLSWAEACIQKGCDLFSRP